MFQKLMLEEMVRARDHLEDVNVDGRMILKYT
jgi:hypothetical protein